MNPRRKGHNVRLPDMMCTCTNCTRKMITLDPLEGCKNNLNLNRLGLGDP